MKIIETPWIAVDLGSDTVHVAFPESTEGQSGPFAVRTLERYFRAVFHVSVDGRKTLVGREAVERLELDPEGVVLARTSTLPRDVPIRLPGKRGEVRPSALYTELLRHIREYCETELFGGRYLGSCVMTIPHRTDSYRRGYRDIALRAGFHQVLLRDAMVSATCAWKHVWEEECEHVIVCNLGASHVAMTLMRCRNNGAERVDELSSSSGPGIDEIDLMMIRSSGAQGGEPQPERFADQLRVKALRERLGGTAFESCSVRLHGRNRSISSRHLEAATTDMAAAICKQYAAYRERVGGIVENRDVPVVIVGGGSNIPAICEAIEREAGNRVFWWGDAENAIVSGSALLLRPKTLSLHAEEPELQYYHHFLNAEQGDVEARYYHAKCLEFGHGTPRSCEEACDWYRLASDQGHAKAKYRLAKLLFLGAGTPHDAEEARRLLEEAAALGHASSQCLLGEDIYKNHPDRRAEAERWIRLSAAQGHPRAIDFFHKHFGATTGIFAPGEPEDTALAYDTAVRAEESVVPGTLSEPPNDGIDTPAPLLPRAGGASPVNASARPVGIDIRETWKSEQEKTKGKGKAKTARAPTAPLSPSEKAARDRFWGFLATALILWSGTLLLFRESLENPTAQFGCLVLFVGAVMMTILALLGLPTVFYRSGGVS